MVTGIDRSFDSIDEPDMCKLTAVIENGIADLSGQVTLALEEVITQWEFATRTHQ